MSDFQSMENSQKKLVVVLIVVVNRVSWHIIVYRCCVVQSDGRD